MIRRPTLLSFTSALRLLAAFLALSLAGGLAVAGEAPRQCVVSILNRTAEVGLDGSWQINNLPAGLGQVRARFTCVENGVTRTGQSKFFDIAPNAVTGFESEFLLGASDPVPASIALSAKPSVLTAPKATTQLSVIARFPDGSTQDVTAAERGTTYITSNPRIATVSGDGLVTALMSGRALISAMNESILGSIFITVSFSGDTDGDGIPDDVELSFGLDPNNPDDARDDPDQDGLTNLQEIALGTDLFVADTDGDGVSDGAEVAAGTDPLDPASANYTGLLRSLAVSPPAVTLRTNAILPAEVRRQLTVTGTLEGGRIVDLTASSRGTSYSSSNLLVVNFGERDGELFAGQPGSATVRVSNAGLHVDVSVDVTIFNPVALGFVAIPGHANNVDVEGSYAYVAAGAQGLQVVDVGNPRSPRIVGARDTPGNANDVKVDGGFAYVADGASGLQVIDISDPTAPVIAGAVDTPGTANDVVVSGSFAYVADGSAGLQIIDISDPADPRIAGTVDTPGTAFGVDVDPLRNIAVVADGSTGLQVIDISDRAAPAIIGAVDTRADSDGGLDVVLEGTFAYVANGTSFFGPIGGLAAVDVSDPRNPVLTAVTPASSNLWDVVTGGGLALAADNFSVNAVHTFNLGTPSTPVASQLIDFSRAPSSRDDNGTGIDIQGGFVYMTGVLCISHHGSTCSGGLHIGQYLELVDDAGVPPEVAITEPQPGAEIVAGTIFMAAATATDDVQVAAVEFLLDGEVVARDSSAPYSALILAPADLGTHHLGARAIDLGNNVSELVEIEFTVLPDRPPEVTITSPEEGAMVIEGSTIVLSAEASDDVGVALVRFSTSTAFERDDTTSEFAVDFVVPLGISELTVHASAFDTAGQESFAQPVTVTVIPDPGTTVAGSVLDAERNPVEGAALSTNGGVTGVSLADGSFSLPGVPTILGAITVHATALIDGSEASGISQAVAPVPGGTTDAGIIVLRSGIDLLIIFSGGTPPVNEMLATGAFDSVDAFHSLFGTPEAEQLAGYDVILNYTDNTPQNPTLLGDRLADYVDGGGNLVLCTYSFSSPWAVGGRIMTAGYSPLVNLGQNTTVSSRIVPELPGDPVFQGVDLSALTFFSNFNFARPGLEDGSTLLATDGAGVRMMARNAASTVIGINVHPAGGNFGGNNEQLYRLVASALVTLAGGRLGEIPAD
jgi:hypothetical protein